MPSSRPVLEQAPRYPIQPKLTHNLILTTFNLVSASLSASRPSTVSVYVLVRAYQRIKKGISEPYDIYHLPSGCYNKIS